MMRSILNGLLVVLLLGCFVAPVLVSDRSHRKSIGEMDPSRQEVVFWHFWGGAELAVVNDVVRRFNTSQSKYFVRGVAMPGNNLDLKLFLSLAGGDPPDVVNIDDPVLADWAERGAIRPLTEVASERELERLSAWLFPAARKLTSYRDQQFGLCNGLDVRALYYNKTLLDSHGLAAPTTLAELDKAAELLTPPESRLGRVVDEATSSEASSTADVGFLPNAKNLWAWGVVFGGSFYDADCDEITLDSRPIVEALEWMAGYGKRFGKLAAALRARDQSLPGKTFPLLTGRYAMVVDGQWRVRDIDEYRQAASAAGRRAQEFGVTPLPSPGGARPNAGWINGNYFVLPKGTDACTGGWEFMKFWAGFGHEDQAADTCREGGWIPVSQKVVDQPQFQSYLIESPLFAKFVELAGSDQQVPRPNVPGAARFDREVRALSETAMNPSNEQPFEELIKHADERIQTHIEFHRGRNR